MRTLPSLLTTLALFAATNFAHAAQPQAVVAHVAIAGSGEYCATVIKSTGDLRSGDPTTLWVRTGDGSLELKLAYFGPDRFHYEIKRNGEHAFSLTGVVPPPLNKPLVIGAFPASQDVKLWLTDR